ncbi:phospholipase A2 inhibitor isoform X2 [Daktulosphaira vitifoliae]|uniref:phospholipase A2 inhibitor isoform X2 n=1 Tax=Daktulosphaira vitifoliae TaxID=58002 RepID=UPI0021AA1572|nr:phospholipase A2 inhibitor isoform X2 [Daktulosphaira vitifoliae]
MALTKYKFTKMKKTIFLLLLNFSAVMSELIRCNKPVLNHCYCGKTTYDRQELYAVNCTNTLLSTKESLDVFKNLPSEIEVLIFTGNFLEDLPSNIFGMNNSIPKLKFLDMSNNSIQSIKGKSFHHVSSVERLILNHNKIELNGIGLHPRVFSNFENLLELHMIDAFANTNKYNISQDLYEVFLNSNLSQLAKLHLEQNDISIILEPQVFCPLSSLLDLHLSNNQLTGIDFFINCLPHIRFLGLENNHIQKLSESQLSTLDLIHSNNQNLAIDLSNNPFSCGCNIEILYKWLQTTHVNVRNNETIKCNQEVFKNIPNFYIDYGNKCPEYIHSTILHDMF